MSAYGSAEHEEMVKEILSVLKPEYLAIANKIPGLTPHETIIWHMTSLWMNAAQRLDRDKLLAHKEQFKFILYSVGHIVELLDDKEWDLVETEWMTHLACLRTFNDSFLGFYFSRKEISDRTADFYNIYAWLITLHYWFGDSVFQKIKSKLEDPSSEDSLIANTSMNNLLANITEFTDRYNLDTEISNFIQQGLNLVVNKPPDSPWELYFESQKNQIKLPSFSAPK
jgi:hypothetical protein